MKADEPGIWTNQNEAEKGAALAQPGKRNRRRARALWNPLRYPICLSAPRKRSTLSAWKEHIPFAMLLVELTRPRVIVELGTHGGDSYCAFCQAVQELGLPTRCYAVDTWRGDGQTGPTGPRCSRSYVSITTHFTAVFPGLFKVFSTRPWAISTMARSIYFISTDFIPTMPSATTLSPGYRS